MNGCDSVPEFRDESTLVAKVHVVAQNKRPQHAAREKSSENRVCSIITGDHAAFRVARAVCRVTVVR